MLWELYVMKGWRLNKPMRRCEMLLVMAAYLVCCVPLPVSMPHSKWVKISMKARTSLLPRVTTFDAELIGIIPNERLVPFWISVTSYLSGRYGTPMTCKKIAFVLGSTKFSEWLCLGVNPNPTRTVTPSRTLCGRRSRDRDFLNL